MDSNFVLLPIHRGLDEIIPILQLLGDKNAFICGGYARYCASPNETPVKAGDVDIYCYDEDAFEEIFQHFKSVGMEVRFDSEVALTYLKPKDDANPYFGCPVIQLIKPINQGAIIATGSMESILNNFDFSVIRCGIVWTDDGWRVLADEDFVKDEGDKFLRIKNIHCPISSLLRFMKYARKGYDTKPSQLIKLFADWDNRSDAYRSRLFELFRAASDAGEMTQAEIDELEALLRID